MTIGGCLAYQMSVFRSGQGGGAEDGVAGSFPGELGSPGESSTQTTVVSDDISLSPPPIPARSVARNPTPRPYLFPSLQEAHSHVYRNQSKQSSRDASGDTSTHGRVGDEPEEEDMTPLTSAFGRSLTTSAQQSVAYTESRKSPVLPEYASSPAAHGFTNITLPPFEPIDWENAPKPLNTIRMVSSDAESINRLPTASSTNPPHVSGSSVDRIIDQYVRQSSSAAQSHVAEYATSSDVDSPSRQHESDAGGILGVNTTRAQEQGCFRILTPHPASARGNFLTAAHTNTPPPEIPLPADPPVRPSSPFVRPDTPRPLTGGPIPSVFYSSKRRPLSVSDESFSDEDQENKVDMDPSRDQKTPGSDSRVMESATASDAGSGVAQLTAPPQRLHSARRAKNMRYSMRSTGSKSPGDYFSEDSDEDPFKYESLVMRPSKERAVSACLRKVSGLERESRASIYSQDGTPSKTFGHHYELFGNVASPGMQRSVGNWRLQAPSHRAGNVPRNPYNNQAIGGEGDNFYNANAIESGWAVEDLHEVKVPVNKNLFGGAQQNLTEASGPRDENQLAWDQLRREQQHTNRLTGNTDD